MMGRINNEFIRDILHRQGKLVATNYSNSKETKQGFGFGDIIC